jgi:ribosomal protein S18 acetylase RimI-like enzyme
MSWASLTGDEVALVDSPAETARFGVTMARLTVGTAADAATRAAALDRALAGAGADVAVAASGRDVLPAGALVYWELVPSRRREVPPPADGLTVVGPEDPRAPADLARAVTAVVEASFTGYANHYTVDPLLDDAAALAGYVEWARHATTAGPGDQGVGTLTLLHAGEAVGVATTAVGPEAGGGHHVEVLLAGVAAAWQGRGWYPVLLDAVAARAFAGGAVRLVISTQVHNTRVQRAWARLGLEPYAAVETVHAVRRGLLPPPRG